VGEGETGRMTGRLGFHMDKEKRGTSMRVVFIHCPYSNPHTPQMGRICVENNYPLKK
jgi:hypothetical protein